MKITKQKGNALLALLFLLVIIFIVVFIIVDLTTRYVPYNKKFEVVYHESINRYDIKILKDKSSKAKFLIIENSGLFSHGIAICPLKNEEWS